MDQEIPSLSISEVALEIAVQTIDPEFKSSTVQNLPKGVKRPNDTPKITSHGIISTHHGDDSFSIPEVSSEIVVQTTNLETHSSKADQLDINSNKDAHDAPKDTIEETVTIEDCEDEDWYPHTNNLPSDHPTVFENTGDTNPPSKEESPQTVTTTNSERGTSFSKNAYAKNKPPKASVPHTDKIIPEKRNMEKLASLNLSSKWNVLEGTNKSDLIVIEINVQGGLSRKAKRMDLANIADLTNADIMVVTEHHKEINKNTTGEEIFHYIKNDKYLKIEGYWSTSKQRQGNHGGVAIYWKKKLNAEEWEGPNLPSNLKHAGLERIWIKVKCSYGSHAIGGVYIYAN